MCMFTTHASQLLTAHQMVMLIAHACHAFAALPAVCCPACPFITDMCSLLPMHSSGCRDPSQGITVPCCSGLAAQFDLPPDGLGYCLGYHGGVPVTTGQSSIDCTLSRAAWCQALTMSGALYPALVTVVTPAAAAADMHSLCVCTGQCSVYGVCLGSTTSTPKTAPTIALRITAAAPATTSIKQGYNYTACLPGQQPYKGAECELGATAQDAQAGNLTSRVLVCAPAACTASACVSGGVCQPFRHVLVAINLHFCCVVTRFHNAAICSATQFCIR